MIPRIKKLKPYRRNLLITDKGLKMNPLYSIEAQIQRKLMRNGTKKIKIILLIFLDLLVHNDTDRLLFVLAAYLKSIEPLNHWSYKHFYAIQKFNLLRNNKYSAHKVLLPLQEYN